MRHLLSLGKAAVLLWDLKRNVMGGSTAFVLEPLPDDLERLWRAFDRSGAHSFFLSWPWIGTLLKTVRRPPQLLRAVQGSETAGLALLMLGAGRFRKTVPVRQAWLNATGEPDIDAVMLEHNGFAVPGKEDPTLIPALIGWFGKKGAVAADQLGVPGVSPLLADAERGPLLLVEKRSTGYRTPLGGIGDGGIEALLSRNARQQLRRSLRDYGEALSLQRAADTDTALEYFTEMKTLHVRSWTRRGRSHAFAKPAFESFHRALIPVGMVDGAVDMLRVSAGGQVLGYLYNFRRNGTVSNYQSGFADETPGLRPGYVCHALAIAHYAGQGLRTYDFLAGTNRLKQSFGMETYELCWRQYRRQTLLFLADELIRRVAARWKSQP